MGGDEPSTGSAADTVVPTPPDDLDDLVTASARVCIIGASGKLGHHRDSSTTIEFSPLAIVVRR